MNGLSAHMMGFLCPIHADELSRGLREAGTRRPVDTLKLKLPARFVQKYTLRARLEPSGAHEAVEGRRDTPVSLAMAVLETPNSRKLRMASSFAVEP